MDFLPDAEDADRLHGILLALGYRRVRPSADAANYVREDEGPDHLYAHRPVAPRLLAGAEERSTALESLRVIGAEGLIGLKLPALVNNPSRIRDLGNIRALSRARRGRFNMQEAQQGFVLFDRQEMLDEFLAEIASDKALKVSARRWSAPTCRIHAAIHTSKPARGSTNIRDNFARFRFREHPGCKSDH